MGARLSKRLHCSRFDRRVYSCVDCCSTGKLSSKYLETDENWLGSRLCLIGAVAHRVRAVHVVPFCHYLHLSRQFKGFGCWTTITHVTVNSGVLYAAEELGAPGRCWVLGNNIQNRSPDAKYVQNVKLDIWYEPYLHSDYTRPFDLGTNSTRV